MSDQKDTPLLTDRPEGGYLPEVEKSIELPLHDHQLELVAPTETILLPEYGTTEAESIAHTITTSLSGQETTSLALSADSTLDMSDPSIFDAVAYDSKISVSSAEETQGIVSDIAVSNDLVKESELMPPTTVSVVAPKIEVSTPQNISTAEVVVDYEQPLGYSLVSIILGTVLLLVGVVGLGYFFIQDREQGVIEIETPVSSEMPPTVVTYTDTVTQNIRSDEKDIENMNRALSENSSPLCDTIQNQSRKTECHETLKARSIAVGGTIQDCQTLTLPDIRSNCISVVVQSSAITALDRSLCSQIDDVVQVSYCGELVDQKLLSQLIESNTASTDTCGRLTDKYKTQCLMAVKQTDDSTLLQDAVAQESLDVCKSLSTEDLQITCFDTILLKQALKSGDKNLCDLVRDERKKTTCLSYMDKKDDSTVFKSAIVEKNLTMCSEITVESLKNRCHDSVTLLLVRDTKNPLLCDTLIATGSIESCKKSVVVQ